VPSTAAGEAGAELSARHGFWHSECTVFPLLKNEVPVNDELKFPVERAPGHQVDEIPRNARDRHIVEQGFWPKLRAVAGRLPFAEDLLAAYFAATDSRTPTRVRAILFGALAYFVLPADMIPDFIAGLGYTDDAAVLAAALSALARHITPEHRQHAHQTLTETHPHNP